MPFPVVPEYITVHLGPPNEAAENVTVPFTSYIKNVASSEVYPTWPENALRANILAQISVALNRVYTEYYRSRGYDFDITSSTRYDQAFVPGRSTFENIDRLVDDIFNNYIVRQGNVEPLYAQFCDGVRTQCAGLSQWGSVDLAEQGLTPYEILQYYYGDNINIELDADMKLTGYCLSYHDVEFASPENMLSAEQIMAKFRESNTLDLYYLARTGNKRTGTVLVYGCDNDVYADAFTGEPVYTWAELQESDLSGITDTALLRKAQELEYNGLTIMRKGEKQTDAVSQYEFADLISRFTDGRLYRLKDSLTLPSGAVFRYDEQKLTRADAMVIYAAAACGTKLTEMQGIFKNPFTDVDDGDKFLGCYAAAYALGATDGSALNGSAAYTYAELINLVYDNLT